MTITKENFEPLESVVMERLRTTGVLNDLMNQIDAGTLQVTGEGGFLKEMTKAVLKVGFRRPGLSAL